MSTLADIQSASWYSGVKAAMDAQNVPEAVWASTLLVEDNSLNPSISHYDPDSQGNPGYSYGLFQLRQPGIGSGYQISDLESADSNASIAAKYMGQAIAALPANSSPSDELIAVEQAGWPGNLSENTQRQAALTSVLTAGGQKYTTSGNGNVTATNATPDPLGLNSAFNNAVGSAQNYLTGVGKSVQFYSIVGLLILGGFLLIVAAVLQRPEVQQAIKTTAEAAK